MSKPLARTATDPLAASVRSPLAASARSLHVSACCICPLSAPVRSLHLSARCTSVRLLRIFPLAASRPPPRCGSMGGWRISGAMADQWGLCRSMGWCRSVRGTCGSQQWAVSDQWGGVDQWGGAHQWGSVNQCAVVRISGAGADRCRIGGAVSIRGAE